MKGKQLLLVLSLLVLLGGAALFLRQRDRATWSQSTIASNEKILDFPLNDVAHLTIQETGTELNLIKKEETWRVAERADYPADFEKVAGLIRRLWELRAVQKIEVDKAQLGRLHLLAPGSGADSATLIDLRGEGEKRLSGLLLGKQQFQTAASSAGGGHFPVGRYVMPPAQTERVFLVAETFGEIQTKAELWLDHSFIKVENPKSISLAGRTPAERWKIARENATAPWILADAPPREPLDAAKASSVANTLAAPNFADVLKPDAPPAETGLDQPSILSVTTFDGFKYELRIGKLMAENYPVLISVEADLPKERSPGADEKPEDKAKLDQEFQEKQKQLEEKLKREQQFTARPYLVAKTTVDNVMRERASLLKPPATPTPAATPAAKTSPVKPAATPARRPKT